MWENKSIAYAYDNRGNITSKKEYAYTTGTLGTATKTVSYAYGNTGWKDLLTSYNGQSITYDTIGNPLSYRGMTLTWANGRQLATLTKSGKTTSYEYDINGRRTKKVANGVTTEYYYSGEQYTGMHTSDGKDVGAILDASGGLYGIYYDDSTIGTDVGQTYYFVYNGQGDVIGLYNHGGKLIATYAYDAWGRCIEAKAVTADDDGHAVTDPDHIAFINPFRYRGYMYDAESGLYYLQSRYYDPEVGRFINADTAFGQIGNVQGSNVFTYCFNNPIMNSDTNGNWPKLSSIFAAVAVAAAVVAVAAVCVATAGTAAVAIGAVSSGAAVLGTSTTVGGLIAGATAAAAAAAKVTTYAAGAALTAAAVETIIDNTPKNNTVYQLVDPATNKVEYVGRTKDPVKRRAAHANNPARANLQFEVIATDLSYAEARGLEQINMLYHHTINASNAMNNQINGISPHNVNLGMYMEAGRGVINYMSNQISNEILYWTGQ